MCRLTREGVVSERNERDEVALQGFPCEAIISCCCRGRHHGFIQTPRPFLVLGSSTTGSPPGK